MSRKILIDASYAEEIRLVACQNNNVVEEFEYQNAGRKLLKGNIYLAKVTRIEPCLQAAFVDYGGEKQGFLPFEEVHYDYYQLPASKQEALNNLKASLRQGKKNPDVKAEGNENTTEKSDGASADQPAAEVVNEGETLMKPNFHKRYKIHEVIKKDQALLVQVTKEERGHKGPTVTTYISLSGRYCVITPNAVHTVGISRKIGAEDERERLKKIAQDLYEQNNHTSLIIRAMGEYRTKTDIKKDFNYLKKLWQNVKAHALSATAPAFIYEEGDLIQKTIRDLYSAQVEEIIISGEETYLSALSFMKTISPRYVNKLKEYKESTPIFTKFNVEGQIADLYGNKALLKSGGYIIINQAEALVAIDVNSGKSTAERNIEDTALKTNIEAAHEIAKQLRLRNLSGLIVIDFIDMANYEHRKTIERHLKEAVLEDKAKVQVGKISEFGLLEMSRQRLGHSFTETHLLECSHCSGKGRVRPLNATAIAIFRAIESDLAINHCTALEVSTSKELALYLLNNKRKELSAFEEKNNIKISIHIDETAGVEGFFIERNFAPTKQPEIVSAMEYNSYTETTSNETPEPKAEKQGNAPQRPHKTQQTSSTPNQSSKQPNERQDSMNAETIRHTAATTTLEESNNKTRRRKFIRKRLNNGPHYKKSTQYYGKPKERSESSEIKEVAPRSKDGSFLKKIWKKIVE